MIFPVFPGHRTEMLCIFGVQVETCAMRKLVSPIEV